MQQTLPLFDPPDQHLKSGLQARLQRLANEHRWFIGTSSWKYEGWLGRVYTRDRYLVQGRFSKKRFEEECLAEYAEVFRIVCGDFSFYQFPSAVSWRRLFQQAPAPFQFAFKIPEEITLPAFPNHSRYGARAGQLNPNFLSAELLRTQFLDLLEPHAHCVALLIFEFPASTGAFFPGACDFARALNAFLTALPKHFRYGVEIRHAKFLEREYFYALREQGAAHVFNSWTDMPSLAEQMSNTEAFTAVFTAARALLRPGRPYDESKQLFAPYDTVREPNAEVRAALRALLQRAKRRAEPTFLFVNNRLEGFAPGTIEAVLDGIEGGEASE